MDMSFKKIAIATTTVTCATLFSFGWSEQRGASLSIESAQARIGRPLTPVSVAGVARQTTGGPHMVMAPVWWAPGWQPPRSALQR